ncbi:ABC transporter permease [Alloscardovia venturai]|uniref:ABC transporter permease n=1 Tax=Alloscardovia venturai TaxID=1769421 RepID=A0ABW2Y6M9_9BIFI
MRKLRIVTRSLLHRWDGAFPLIFIGIWILVSCVSLVWTPFSLSYTNGYNVWTTPSRVHWLGTDGAGVDSFSWLMAGSATELLIVVIVAMVTLVVGIAGVALTVTHSFGFNRVIIVVVDALISIPVIVVALLCAAPYGATIVGVIVSCAFAYSLNLIRVVRPVATAAAASDYVVFARYKGKSDVRVFFDHIMPSIMPAVIINVSLAAATSILAESGLTYLGVGVPSSVPSWGHSLATTSHYISIHPSVVMWPGLIITLAVIALNLVGDAMREVVDPLTNPALKEV